jgi:hypothetical protein
MEFGGGGRGRGQLWGGETLPQPPPSLALSSDDPLFAKWVEVSSLMHSPHWHHSWTRLGYYADTLTHSYLRKLRNLPIPNANAPNLFLIFLSCGLP